MKWVSNPDLSLSDGHGQFEENSPLIHFDQFSDYFYIQ